MNIKSLCVFLWAFIPLHVLGSEAITLDTLAFGSCLRQTNPQPIWSAVLESKPDAFVFLGDNVYANTRDISVMRTAYATLAGQRGFQQLQKASLIHAIWDDNDYGKSDAGAEFPMKEASRNVFLDFFKVPADDERRQRSGIYGSTLYGTPGKRVQIILLDTRYFRSPLKRGMRTLKCLRTRYVPNDAEDATMLGARQWHWLKEQLLKPAELRIIASSIQVIPEQHCFEKWANFPRERQRLFKLIRDTKANGVVFISGDRHLAEISRIRGETRYPVYEVTSSGMNSAGAGKGEQNRFRTTVDNFRGDNFGVIEIDWSAAVSQVNLKVLDVKGNVMLRHSYLLEDIPNVPLRH